MNSGASLDDGDVVNSFAGADLNGIVPAQEREASALGDTGGTHAKAPRREGERQCQESSMSPYHTEDERHQGCDMFSRPD
jgi:hypothetical protein